MRKIGHCCCSLLKMVLYTPMKTRRTPRVAIQLGD